ncbi:MAG TPA: hypothetical protein VKZ18_18030 [Polyangia bacterium]|nr:hypothetical protein [Polyangia bacterium]
MTARASAGRRPARGGLGWLAIAVALGLGCAPELERRAPEARPSSLSDGDRQAVDEAESAQRRAEGELGAAWAAAAPDCPRACELAANVCALAERICAIAARYPAEDPVASRCADGRARCARAEAAVAGPCGCQPRTRR